MERALQLKQNLINLKLYYQCRLESNIAFTGVVDYAFYSV